MKNQQVIQSDTYFICERLKEIDNSYFIIFNFNKNKFEIHSTEQKGDTYCLTIPYNVLDERTLDLVKKTRAINVDKLIEEIDQENEKLQSQREKNAANYLKEVMYDS